MDLSTTNLSSESGKDKDNSSFLTADPKQLKDGFVTKLDGLGLMAASGIDAVPFIHGQLSNDIEHLGQAQSRLAGYSTPKGRLLATFLIWKTTDRILMQLPREVLPALQKRLQMYVLRAKVTLADTSDEYVALGLGGRKAAEALSLLFATLPSEPYAIVQSESGTLIRVADAFGFPRYQLIAKPDDAREAWDNLTSVLQPTHDGAWRMADIDAGIPQITVTTQDQFVAQMVNLEVVGGVSFKKGCYPGQEIIARTQYLGKAKRRMLPASIDLDADRGEATAGNEVYSEADPGQPCGMIVSAQRTGSSQVACLVSVRMDMLEKGTVHLGSADGPSLQFGDLPYELPDTAPAPTA